MPNNVNAPTTYCGYVALIGRPNVGKSTLINALLRQKISIISHKPQTTRHRILGIKTQGNYQTIYVDTPGIHKNFDRLLNREMNRTARQAIQEVDIILFLIDVRFWTDEDEMILSLLKEVQCPIILIPNKVDLIKNSDQLLPILDQLSKKLNWQKIIPLSAKKRAQLPLLEQTIQSLLPQRPHEYPATQSTNQSEKFLMSEVIREKLIFYTHQELPYDTAVVIDSLQEKNGILHIDAIIWVARPGQKAIVIGHQGDKLKIVGQEARLELEKLLKRKIFLTLWVKVRDQWTEDAGSLTQLGM